MTPGLPPVSRNDHAGRVQRWLPWVVLAVISAAVSFNIGTSFDEAIWITVGRKALAGHRLYVEAIDHKTPFVLLVAGALDLAPGPFAIARGIFLGTTVATAGFLAQITTRSLGLSRNQARAIGLVIGFAAALQTVFTLTVELLAATVLIGALAASAKGWYRTAGVLGAASAFIDIRVALLGIGLLSFSWERGGRCGLLRTASTAVPVGLVGFAFLIAHPDTRFGILEMSFASREIPWDLVSQTGVALRALLFPAVAVWLVTRPNRSSLRGLTWNSSAVFLLFSAMLLAVLSRFNFDHYWLLVLPAIPVLAARIAPEKPDGAPTIGLGRALAAAVITMSMLPALLNIAPSIEGTNANDERTARAAEYLDTSLGIDGTFVKFGDLAFIAALLPERYGAPSPVMHYYVLNTSRQDRARLELYQAIENAWAIVDEGELAVEEESVFPHLRPVHQIFTESVSDFPCLRKREGYVFHFRTEVCPPD